MFSDDSAIVGCVSEGNDQEPRSVIMDFVDWREHNHFCLNTSKTRETVTDFQRNTPLHSPLSIQGADIEVVVPGCSPQYQTELVQQYRCFI
uniref:Reverse transcriptase domain-containing protein n=1 Tax=Nothobranchius pienaari TaxID=704102 RepID=A0A1A8NAL1_9TELE